MIQFDYPEVFLLAIPLWFAMRRWGRVKGPTGWLRVVFVLLMLTALAFPRLNMAGKGMDLILVVDRSRSMPATNQALKDLINDVENNRRVGDRVAVVTFGTRAETEHELSETTITSEFTHVIDENGSDLNEAILTALDRRTNPDRPARIMVLTDGLYNGPTPLYAARRAREQGVPVDFREFSKPVVGDVAIESIQLPREVAPNEPFQFSVLVYADMDREGTVVVKRNGTAIAQRKTSLLLGINNLIFRDWVQDPGIHQYTAEVVFEDGMVESDPVPENDQAGSVMRVKAAPRLLLVTHDGQPGNIGRALQAGKIPFDVIQPSDSSMTLDALDAYRAVILENVPADSVGRVRMERLRQFVEDVGGGLMMTGGQQSYGNGGYYKSPLDEVLPVALDSIEETRRARAAIVVVLDRSGSMSAPVGNGKTKMDLANIGTAECVRLLSSEDMVSVIAVDSSPHLIQKMTRVENPGAICSRVLKIRSMGGGIFVYEGLVAAGRELLTATDYATRHIVLFSDAADSEQPGDYKNLLAQFANAGITVSVIGLGTDTDSDAGFLKDIALRGNGNINFTNDPLDLPRLFTQDTMSMTRNMFLTKATEDRLDGFPGKVLPDVRLLGDLGVGDVPSVDGYNLTFLKPDATQGAVSLDDNNAPFSAFWYRGLGRVAAITLELDGQYSGQLSNWDQYESFVLTHARWLLGDEEAQDVFVSMQQDGLDAVVQVELDPNRPNQKRGITPQLAIIPPSQERSEVVTPDLTWTGPNTLEGRFRLEQQGTWRTLIKTGEREFVQGPALSLPYSPEFMPRQGLPSGQDTLKAIGEISGGTGRVNLLEVYDNQPTVSRNLRSLVPWLCLVGMCFLLTEIAGRRWNWWDRLATARSSRAARKTVVAGTESPPAEKGKRARKKKPVKRPAPETTVPQPVASASDKQDPPQNEPSANPADVFARAKSRAKKRIK